METSVNNINSCKTPQQLADLIFRSEENKELFVGWVRAYAEGITPKQWFIYRNPRQLAESIWKTHQDVEGDGRGRLREALEEWIENYAEGE